VSNARVLVWLLLEQEDAVLLALRKPDRPPLAGRWQLPGDLMPTDESADETLARCAREQLDLRLEGNQFVDTLYLAENAQELAVNVFRVGYEGRPRFRASGPFAEVRWLLRADLPRLDGMVPGLRDLLLAGAGSQTRAASN
jgi:ADP-ribose pyrophosphatase YjhB (NUDIX family)